MGSVRHASRNGSGVSRFGTLLARPDGAPRQSSRVRQIWSDKASSDGLLGRCQISVAKKVVAQQQRLEDLPLAVWDLLKVQICPLDRQMKSSYLVWSCQQIRHINAATVSDCRPKRSGAELAPPQSVVAGQTSQSLFWRCEERRGALLLIPKRLAFAFYPNFW